MSKFSLSGMTTKSSQEPGLSAWRADFRKTENLPDVKAVRTDFLVNYGIAALALGVLAYAVVKEMSYESIRKEIAVISGEIETRKSANDANLKASFEFNQYIKFSDEFLKFKKPVPVSIVDVLSSIGGIKADKVSFKSLLIDTTASNILIKNKKNMKVVLTGSVKGTGSAEFKLVEDVYERFKSMPIWGQAVGYTVNAQKSPTSVIANTQDKVIDFTFELPLEPKK